MWLILLSFSLSFLLFFFCIFSGNMYALNTYLEYLGDDGEAYANLTRVCERGRGEEGEMSSGRERGGKGEGEGREEGGERRKLIVISSLTMEV